MIECLLEWAAGCSQNVLQLKAQCSLSGKSFMPLSVLFTHGDIFLKRHVTHLLLHYCIACSHAFAITVTTLLYVINCLLTMSECSMDSALYNQVTLTYLFYHIQSLIMLGSQFAYHYLAV